MTPSSSTNSPSVSEAAAAHDVAEGLWARAAEAGQRLRAGDDAEALHGFRVAIRRLRTCLESYPEFREGEGLRLRKRLARIMRQTNERRDVEVHEVLCRQHMAEADLTSQQVAGFTEVLEHLDEARTTAARHEASKLVERFAKLHKRAERLTPAAVDDTDPPTLPDATRPVIRRLAQRLRDDLNAITDVSMERAIHRARLTVKRLRYVTEPLKRTVPEVRPLLADVKDLQAHLGDLRDFQTLDQRIRSMPDPSAAALSAADVVREDLHRRFHQLRERWLDPERPVLFARAEALIDALE